MSGPPSFSSPHRFSGDWSGHVESLILLPLNHFCMDFGSLFLPEDSAMAPLKLLGRHQLIFFLYNFLLLHEVSDAMSNMLNNVPRAFEGKASTILTNPLPYLTVIMYDHLTFAPILPSLFVCLLPKDTFWFYSSQSSSSIKRISYSVLRLLLGGIKRFVLAHLSNR